MLCLHAGPPSISVHVINDQVFDPKGAQPRLHKPGASRRQLASISINSARCANFVDAHQKESKMSQSNAFPTVVLSVLHDFNPNATVHPEFMCRFRCKGDVEKFSNLLSAWTT